MVVGKLRDGREAELNVAFTLLSHDPSAAGRIRRTAWDEDALSEADEMVKVSRLLP